MSSRACTPMIPVIGVATQAGYKNRQPATPDIAHQPNGNRPLTMPAEVLT